MNIIQHKCAWKECDRCEIGKRSSRRVFYRGDIPADILIVGEAPGDVEAVLEEPFVGPAGKLLDALIDEAYDDHPPSICFTNAVICIPQGDVTAMHKLRAPTGDEVINCSSRLTQFITIVNPKVIIAAGKVAHSALVAAHVPLIFQMPHPSAILRQGERGGLDHRRAIKVLKDAHIALSRRVKTVN